MQGFKPLLAGKVNDTASLDYQKGWLMSPKLDGIRAVNLTGNSLVSRNLKPIPNAHVQSLFGRPEFQYMDGELICGSPTDKDCYRKTNSAVMSEHGTPDVKLYVFDYFERHDQPYETRLNDLRRAVAALDVQDHVVIVPNYPVASEESLLGQEEAWLTEGYEGVMVRRLDARYKFGRSTDKEGTLLKLKRFDDAEAQIIGFEELMHNANEATKDALGHTERSSHKEGLVSGGTLGALVVRNADGVEFNIGTGFTADDRAYIWAHRDSIAGRYAKYKSFSIGVKDKPRFPVFLGFRAEGDM